MRIIFLTFQLPYPPFSGAAIKTLSLLDHLRANHEVNLLSLRRGPLTLAQKEWAASLDGLQTVELNKPRNAWSLLSSYVARVPLRIERNRSTGMSRVVDAQLDAIRPEVLFIDGLSMAQYAPERLRRRGILHEHNAEYVIWQRQSEIESGPRRWVAASEASRLRRYEASVVRQFGTVFAVSEDDRRILIEQGAQPGRVGVLPNIPDRTLLDTAAPSFTDTGPVILYFGTLSWQPNIEGLERILTSVLPGVRQQVSEARLIVAGVGASQALAARVAATEGAEFRGQVDDPEPLYRSARVLIDATRSGGGTRLKVLNAFARGVPTVATTRAAEGIEVIPGDHLLIADSAADFIDAVVLLLRDGDRWQAISENARALVRARYVAEIAYRPLDEALTRISTGGS
jgi:glycosyltransferase involved in cell wall biosynthesis